MIYMRGHPQDFNSWANITGDNRWSYSNVLEYFKRSEDYFGEWDNRKFSFEKISNLPKHAAYTVVVTFLIFLDDYNDFNEAEKWLTNIIIYTWKASLIWMAHEPY